MIKILLFIWLLLQPLSVHNTKLLIPFKVVDDNQITLLTSCCEHSVFAIYPEPVKLYQSIQATYYYLPSNITASGRKYSLVNPEIAFNKYKLLSELILKYDNKICTVMITDRTPKNDFIDMNKVVSDRLGIKKGNIEYIYIGFNL